MQILPLGTGDAFARDRYSTAFVIEAEGARLLVDCPHPIRKMLGEADSSLDVGDLDGLLLTHLHGDHASGVEGFAFASHFGLQRPVQLLTHPSVAEPLWGRHLEVSMSTLIGRPPMVFADYFTLHALQPEEPLQFGPFTVEVRATLHHIPTWAFRVSAGGRTVGYSADTAWVPELFEWLCEADLVIHETNLGPAHTPFAVLEALPPQVQAKMRLVAWPDGFDPEAGPIAPLRVGERVIV